MTSRHFGVSPKKPLKLLLVGILSLLLLAFSVGFMFSMTPTGVDDNYDINGGKLALITLLVFAITCGLWYLFSFMFSKSERFYFDGDKLHYYYTFVIKKRVALPLDKINVVKLKRRLSDLIAGTATVEIGSGSMTTSLRAEIKLCLSKHDAKYFADYLQRYSKAVKAGQAFDEDINFAAAENADKNTDCTAVVKMTKADKFKLIFTNPSIPIVMLLGLPAFIAPFIVDYIKEGGVETLYIGLIVALVSLALTILCNIIYAFVGLYNYTVSRKGDDIVIHYGLINIKTFSVPLDKIHGYTVGQTLLRQIFRLGSLRIAAVGIDDVNGNNNQSSVTYAYPCGGLKKLAEIVSMLLPEFAGLELQNQNKADSAKPSIADSTDSASTNQTQKGLTRSTSKSLFHSAVIPTGVSVLVFLPMLVYLAIAVSVWILIIPVLAIIALGLFCGIMLCKNAGFAIDEHFVRATSGGWYKKHTVVKTHSVQEISTFAGFIRRKHGLCTYLVIYRASNIFSGRLYVRNLPVVNLDKLN